MPGYVSEPTLPKSWAKMGYAAVGVAPRGKLRSNSQYNPGYPGLLIDRIVDRTTYGYRGFYCDALRAIAGSRKKGLREPELASLLETRKRMSGRPHRPRQADFPEVDPVRGERNIGN